MGAFLCARVFLTWAHSTSGVIIHPSVFATPWCDMKRLLALCASCLGLFLLPLTATAFQIDGDQGGRLQARSITQFNHPWAMTFLPDGRLLVTTKPGRLWLVGQDGARFQVAGVPRVLDGGQGGLGDVVPHPDFADNDLIYLSFVEKGDQFGTRQAVVIRARLDLSAEPKLTDHEEIWRQFPAYSGRGHFSHRLAFGPAGGPHEGKLFITSGDRQEMEPAQDMTQALGQAHSTERRWIGPDGQPVSQPRRPGQNLLDAGDTAIRLVSPLTPGGSCGRMRWGRAMAMS